MPTLLDAESKMFRTYGSPGLPSVALISPSGLILHYHEGVFPMEETLKREVQENLKSRKGSLGESKDLEARNGLSALALARCVGAEQRRSVGSAQLIQSQLSRSSATVEESGKSKSGGA
jgi:hypothetical protein